MTVKSSIDQQDHRGGRKLVRIASASRPGYFHFTTADACSCPARRFGATDCSHSREVRAGLRPFRIERTGSNVYGQPVYGLVETGTQRVEGYYANLADAYADLWSLEFGEVA